MLEYILAFIAYGSIIFLISIIWMFTRINYKCNQDCRQGRDCDCDTNLSDKG